MKVQWGLALFLVLWSSSDVFADSIFLNASSYDVELSLLFQSVGQHLVTVGVAVNHSEFNNFVHVTYNTGGTYRSYVAIAPDGRATLTKKFTRASTFSVRFSALAVVQVSGNLTETEYLEGYIYVRVLDVVYFWPNATDCVDLCSNPTAGMPILNARDVVSVDNVNFVNSILTFSSYYSSYFRVDNTGEVYLKRDINDINPGRYSLRITCDYTLTFRNGSRKLGNTRVYMPFCVLGCPSAEEGSVEWPALHCCQAASHPCSKYHPSLKGGSVLRRCSDEGETLKLDFSQCYAMENDFAPKFAVVWVIFSGRSGSTYLSRLTSIKSDILDIFSCAQANDIQEFAAYQSNKYYGFTMAFLVSLNQNTTENCLDSAYSSLTTVRRLGYQYLRYNREARGLRSFMPVEGCQDYVEMEEDFTSFIPICKQTNTTNCSSCPIIQPTPSSGCPNETIIIDPSPPSPSVSPTALPSPTPQPNIHFTTDHFKANYYSGQANSGAPVINITLNVTNSHLIKDWTSNFGLNGYYSDFFTIGHSSGIITAQSGLRARLYSFDVTVFLTGTLANGESFTNFTEADVSIFVHDGAFFKDVSYTVSVDADVPENTQILSLQNEIDYDRTAVQDMPSTQFTRVSSSSFSITKDGIITTAQALTPRSTVSFTVYLTFQVIELSGSPISGQATTRVSVSVNGCRQEEGGAHVWPVIHPCGIATVNCNEFDDSFDQYGIVRRQCTKEGEWLTPDFSQCRFKAGTGPFVLLWLTFRSTYTRAWQDSYTERAISELRTYMGTLPVSTIAVHSNKESNVVYGHVQSYKITLQPRGPFNDTDLQSLLERIAGIRSIDRRSINTANHTFGLLGFLPKGFCPRYEPEKPEPHYKSVCSLASGSCSCAGDQFEPSECCTLEGKQDKNAMCNVTEAPKGACDKDLASLSASFEVTERRINVTWTVSSGDWPDIVSVNVFFKGFDEEQHFVTSQFSLTTSTSVSGLLPSTVYLVTVTGTYNDQGCLSVYRTYGVKTNMEKSAGPFGSFQMRLNGVTDCKELKANLQSKVREQIVSGIQRSDATFSDDLMGWLFMECPSGLSSSSAVISGWIYGSEGNLASKYVNSMQQMANKGATIDVGTQKLSMDPSCNVALTAPTPPDSACRGSPAPGVAPLASAGGNTIAGTVVGIIIGLFVCILLALILIVLILKFKGRAKSFSFSSHEPSPANEPVSLKEAKKVEEDEAPLEEDF